jgi:hypothetical protein
VILTSFHRRDNAGLMYVPYAALHRKSRLARRSIRAGKDKRAQIGGSMSEATTYKASLEAHINGKDPLQMQSDAVAIVAELIAGVPEAGLHKRPLPNKWSVVEIIAHLAEDELVTSWRYRQMVENSGCALAGFDQDQWARLGDYQSWKSSDALQMFRLLREANLGMLGRLAADEWERCGLHAERGRITVRDLARHMAGHDMNHVDQIRAILKKN